MQRHEDDEDIEEDSNEEEIKKEDYKAVIDSNIVSTNLVDFISK